MCQQNLIFIKPYSKVMNYQHAPVILSKNFNIYLRQSVIRSSDSLFADLNIIQILKRIFWEKFLFSTNDISYTSFLPSFGNIALAFTVSKMVVHVTIQVVWIGLRTESLRSVSTH